MRSLIPIPLLVLLLLASCTQYSDPVTAIRDNVTAMEAALANLDNSGFMEHLAESFNGGETGEALIASADEALYQAKNAGRNRVQAAEELQPTGTGD